MTRFNLLRRLRIRRPPLDAAVGTPVSVSASRVLTREGAPGQEFFLITEGELSVQRNGAEIARLGPGEFFGEMSLLTLEPRTATVVAVTPAVVTVFSRGEFAALKDVAPHLYQQVITKAIERSAGLSSSHRVAVVTSDRLVPAAH